MSRRLGVVHRDGRTFDWNPNHDPQSRRYGVSQLVTAAPTKPVWWTGGPVTDQGKEGACVGHAMTQEFLSSPVRGKLPASGDRNAAANRLAFAIYNRAKEIDPYPGTDYDGTAVNAGMKVGRERGWWSSYHWAFGIEDVKKALLLGPVILGTEWRQGMYETLPGGLVKVDGPVVGGHCLPITGWAPSFGRFGEVFRWRNSWGPSYGKNGNGYIRVADLADLLAREGEAAVPTGRGYGLAA